MKIDPINHSGRPVVCLVHHSENISWTIKHQTECSPLFDFVSGTEQSTRCENDQQINFRFGDMETWFLVEISKL